MRNENKRFENLMIKIDVPKERQHCSESNAMWFLRNGAILYRNHNRCFDAVELAKTVLQQNQFQH